MPFAKTNLEKYKQENQIVSTPNGLANSTESTTTSDSLLAAIQYRDRAKERRDKYGMPEPPFKSDVRERLGIDASLATPEVQPVPKETSNNAPGEISMFKLLLLFNYFETFNSVSESTDSFASKLMRKMGWSEGTGLGKKNQGICAPIEVIIFYH